MRLKCVIGIIVAALFFAYCLAERPECAYAKSPKPKKAKQAQSKEGISALMDLSSSRADMVQELNAETASYKKIKAAVGRAELEKGLTLSGASSRYGEPAIEFIEGENIKWVYKPSDASFFSNEKIYLVFDKENKLIGWKDLSKGGGG